MKLMNYVYNNDDKLLKFKLKKNIFEFYQRKNIAMLDTCTCQSYMYFSFKHI